MSFSNYSGNIPTDNGVTWIQRKATEAFGFRETSDNVVIENCQVQFSSHHGFAIHTGSLSTISKNITIKKVRALYCGNGMLRGQTTDEINRAISMVPERSGYGYYDWSTGFDICETAGIENVRLEDCYALSGWKAGYYTEPKPVPTNIVNLSLIRCRSDDAAQRNWFIRASDGKRYNYCRQAKAQIYCTGRIFRRLRFC